MKTLIFKPNELTSVEFSCEQLADFVIRIDNVTTNTQAHVKLRQRLQELIHNEGLLFEVIGRRQELPQ